MKQKRYLKSLLSLFLCMVLLISSTISVLAATNSVDLSELVGTKNLFENGNFSSIKNSEPKGWTIFSENNTGNYEASTSLKTPVGDTALTLTSTKDYSTNIHGGRYKFWNNSAIIVERNTTYTISFYIKSSISGLTFYLYEPQFEDKNGVRTSQQPQEGINIYTYDYDNGQTRVVRTDIQHNITLSNGYKVPSNNSMTRFGSVISTDYPEQKGTDKWVKYTHTFTTGDLPEHEATVRYGIQIPGSAVGNSISVGSFVATATKNKISKTYTPKVNNGSYGWVEPVEVADGKEVTMVASAAEGREFKGWYKNDIFVTTAPTLSFTWNDNITDPKYEARFDKGDNDNLISAESLEAYANNQSLKTRFGRNQTLWQLAAKEGVSFEFVRASNIRAHGGKMSARVNAGGSYVGYNISNLEPNTEYAFSAYAWIPATSFAKSFSLEEVWVLPKGQALFENKELAVTSEEALAYEQKVLSGNNEWQRFVIKFKTGNTGDVTVWMKSSKYCYMYLDDMAVFKPVTVSTNVEWGGTAQAIPSGTIVKGSQVSFTAQENIGNVFVGWEENGNTVSNNKQYNKIVDTDIELTAKFDGFNKSTEDLFATRGWDGTFENGTVSGWYATHKNPGDAKIVSHCTYSKSTLHAHSGKYSLRACAYHRSTILPLTNLKKNTDYRFTFYYFYEDFGEQVFGVTGLFQNAIIGQNDVDTSTAEIIYDSTKINNTQPNSGWYRCDLYFNTGNQTAVNYVMYYGTNDTSSGCVYYDDMTLSEFYPNENIKNAQFNEVTEMNGLNVSTDWITNGAPVSEILNKALQLDKNKVAYQFLKTETDGLYNVTFKSKGKVRAAAVDLAKTSTDITDLLSSVSYLDTDSNGWKKYSFDFYSGSHKSVKLMFEGLAENSRIDDISVEKADFSDGGIVEKIDFESDRFKFASDTKNNFSIYKKKNDSDKNVLSGDYSLKLTPSSDDKMNRLTEAFLSFRTVTSVSYTVQFNYRSDAEGKIYLSPDLEERFAEDQNFNRTLSNDWQKAEFHFTASNVYVIKAVIAAVLKSAKDIVYFDDIVIKARLPLVSGYDLENTYCDDLYNLVDYQSFENFSEDSSWGKLPKGFKIKEDNNAAASTHIMTVKAGAKKTFVFDAIPATIYELGVSLRGNSKTQGKVYVTLDADGKYYYSDVDGIARSIITPSDDGTWKRSAFSFPAATSGKIYVTIECTKGEMDIDNFMLFKAKFATLVDYNNYTVFVPYDYDNPNYVNVSESDNDILDSQEDSEKNDENNDTPFEEFIEDILEGDLVGALGDLLNIQTLIAVALLSLTLTFVTLVLKNRKGKHYDE